MRLRSPGWGNNRWTWCLRTLTAVCLTGLATAGQVYKSVGPDGKVTYSDTPPTTNSADISKDLRANDPSLQVDALQAALNVFTKEVIVETAYRFCVKEAPQSAGTVRAAHDEWMQRHAALRAKKIAVLHDKFSDSELAQLAVKVGQENGQIMTRLALAPLEQREKWCGNAPKTFAAPEFDLASKPALVDAIMTYQVKGHPK